MPPNTSQTVKRYQDAMGFAPPPGFPSRWPPGTGPRSTSKRNFHGPLRSASVKHSAIRTRRAVARANRMSGLGDGDGLGTWFDDLSAAAGGTVSQALAPATEQLSQLKLAIQALLVLSSIAAGASVLGLLRR